MSKQLRIVLLIILALILVGGYAGYRLYNKPYADMITAQPDFTLSASDLLDDFTFDEAAANQKYYEKIVQVNGKIVALEKGDQGKYTLVLYDSMSGIRCLLNDQTSEKMDTVQIKPGIKITVKGNYAGYDDLFSNVLLNRCIVVKKD
ncbi:MAG TPA: hypothetical protein VE912_12925 [Bacteroidales bacterium]|nr:hypothetical protein [Bacteroidales bacterium]